MLDILFAIILGFVEGLTEFLPVSSTAHLILLGALIGFDDPTGSFKVMIQLGAVLAIVVVYLRKILDTVANLPTSRDARRFAIAIVLAFLPAAAAGVALADIIGALFLEGRGTPEAYRIIATVLIVGGMVMLVVERWRPAAVERKADRLPLWKSLAIGCFQALALVPGVSRSGATIVGAMLLGVERRAAAEFSFFLAMPTMIGAFVYSAWSHREELDFSQIGVIGVGFLAAFAAGLIVVKLFLEIVSRYGFAPFAVYRLALGVLIFATLGFSG